jgi:hypothetical protein
LHEHPKESAEKEVRQPGCDQARSNWGWWWMLVYDQNYLIQSFIIKRIWIRMNQSKENKSLCYSIIVQSLKRKAIKEKS